MSRFLKLLGMGVAMLLSACGPVVPSGPILPTFLPTAGEAVPAPNESYPTAQAAESSASQSVSGFALRLERTWRDGKQVYADVCFAMPDSSDWTIGEHTSTTRVDRLRNLVRRCQPAKKTATDGF
jgi:hypothetical protein